MLWDRKTADSPRRRRLESITKPSALLAPSDNNAEELASMEQPVEGVESSASSGVSLSDSEELNEEIEETISLMKELFVEDLEQRKASIVEECIEPEMANFFPSPSTTPESISENLPSLDPHTPQHTCDKEVIDAIIPCNVQP